MLLVETFDMMALFGKFRAVSWNIHVIWDISLQSPVLGSHSSRTNFFLSVLCIEDFICFWRASCTNLVCTNPAIAITSGIKIKEKIVRNRLINDHNKIFWSDITLELEILFFISFSEDNVMFSGKLFLPRKCVLRKDPESC